jgi:Arc/MetJ family transcription regulator
MRTTVVLDDELVAQARAVLGAETLRGLLEMALRESVKARQREALLHAIASGSMQLAITEADLEQIRTDRATVSEWVTEGFTAAASDPQP